MLPDGEIVCSDAGKFLESLRDGIADIVFLDPPFNLGKRYGRSSPQSDRRSEVEYLAWLESLLDSSVRVLRPGGALYLYHIPKWAIPLAAHLRESVTFRDWIAISLTNGMPPPRRLYPSHYALLYFTKGSPRTFRKIKVPALKCPHCGRYLKNWGGRRRFIQRGVNLSDIWTDLSPIRHTSSKHRRANELPRGIPLRVVQMSGRRGGLFVDPFAGGGSTLLEARQAGLRFLGCDRQRAYFNVMARRLKLN